VPSAAKHHVHRKLTSGQSIAVTSVELVTEPAPGTSRVRCLETASATSDGTASQPITDSTADRHG
jgi:hypothetical protein